MASKEISTSAASADEHDAPHAERKPRLHGKVLKCLAFSVIPVVLGVLFFCFFRLASSVGTDSDGASNILQARAILNGNILLRDWQLSDVSFYTTELPEYVLVVAIRGVRADVVQICAALTYIIGTVLVVLVAKGDASGREGAVRVVVSAGIALAPLDNAQRTLLTNPDHTGTAIPILLLLLLVQRPSLRFRKLVFIVVVLSAAIIGDQLAFVIGVAPLLVVCQLRCRFRMMNPDSRQEKLLSAVACVSALIGWGVPRIIRAVGGWAISGIPATFVGFGTLGSNFLGAVNGVLALFGVQFPPRLGLQTAFAVIHLTGLILVIVAVWLGTRSIRPGGDLVPGLLAAAIIINFAAYVIFVPNPQVTVREIDATVLLGAALAGRMLGSSLSRVRIRLLATGAVLACYAITFAWGVAQPTGPIANFKLGNWLTEHSLTSGLSGYWIGKPLTVSTGGAVQMVVVQPQGRHLSLYLWETDRSTLNPRTNYADFLLLNPPSGSDPRPITEREAVAMFGAPSQVHTYQGFVILVWKKNLLEMIQ
jgi:hypothetical protein